MSSSSSVIIVGRSFVNVLGCCHCPCCLVGWLFCHCPCRWLLVVGCSLLSFFGSFFRTNSLSLSVCFTCAHTTKPQPYGAFVLCFVLFVCFSLTLYSQKAASLDVNWEGAGKEPGNLIWRVENKRDASGNPDFGIRVWPKDRYGEFYTGDSYIVLHTSKEEGSDSLQWDIYFWIGSQSSQDEYGVGTYVCVCVCLDFL